ncbi:hypothetical protein GCM10027168_42380 [Streptomyces capparidis]
MTAIAIDAGTTTIEAGGYGDDGTEPAVSRRPTRVARPRPRWSEQDMSEVWAAVAATPREVVAALPEALGMVAVTAQGDGARLVDDRGRPTGPAVLWNEVGARGAWLTGLVATGREPGFATAAARHVRAAAAFDPDPGRAAAFGGRYADFPRVGEPHRPIWTSGRGRTRPDGGGGA